MNNNDNRKRNRKVGIILGLVFIGLFTATTLGLVFGLDAPPSVKTIVSVITTIIASVIGIFLIGAAFYEIIIKTVMDWIEKRLARRIQE